jgi:hypothetical protein
LTGNGTGRSGAPRETGARNIPEAAEAAKAVDLIEDGIALSRKLAKGLQP